MRFLRTALLATMLGLSASASGQSSADEQAIRALPQSFCAAWAKHDGHALAGIMSDDVDFVTVATTYLHGRENFEKFHVRLLSGRFKDSTITPIDITARFLRPNFGVVIGVGRSKETRTPMVRLGRRARG
jgi:uncharacterized protein (TIGR02246 family)